MKFRITLLLLTIILPVLSSADVPDYLKNDSINELCKKVNCHSEFDNYYRTKYIAKSFHKALAISSTKSGNRYSIDYFAMAWNYPTHTEARQHVNHHISKLPYQNLGYQNNNKKDYHS